MNSSKSLTKIPNLIRINRFKVEPECSPVNNNQNTSQYKYNEQKSSSKLPFILPPQLRLLTDTLDIIPIPATAQEAHKEPVANMKEEIREFSVTVKQERECIDEHFQYTNLEGFHELQKKIQASYNLEFKPPPSLEVIKTKNEEPPISNKQTSKGTSNPTETPKEKNIKNEKTHLNCEFCNKAFVKTFLYKSHLKKHSDERPFICDICNMSFKHRGTIVKHLKLHMGLKPIQCPYCSKTYTDKGTLKPHLLTHTKIKDFICPICQKAFSYKHNMQKHVRIHARPKILQCWICQKTFPRESRLKYHLQVHTKLKPFTCDICKYVFSHKQNVLRHIIAKHPGSITPSIAKCYRMWK